MYEHLECIALRTVKLNDSKNLLSAWTRQYGRVTFSMPAGAGREARRRRALTSPLCRFEGECDFRSGREVLSLRDFQMSEGSLAFEMSPVKGIMAMFLGQALDLLLKQGQNEESLSAFLFDSVRALEQMSDSKALSTFHLVFLYRFMHFVGIAPELDNRTPGAVFDMRQGRFSTTYPLHPDFLYGRQVTALLALSRARYGTHLPLDHPGRRQALDLLLDFYAMHLYDLRHISSLDIIRQLSM